jgi:cytidine deaminase
LSSRSEESQALVGRAPTVDELWLYEAAEAARERAYAPYSRFQVGAALVTSAMGSISDRPAPVTAANVENASYGLTICAERAAIGRALAEGACPEAVAQSKAAARRRKKTLSPACVTAIAIAGADAKTVPPCGACRQVLQQLATPDAIVIIHLAGRVRTFDLAAMLPVPFEF